MTGKRVNMFLIMAVIAGIMIGHVARADSAALPEDIPEFKLIGTARDVDGRYFAILQDIGVVTEGEILFVTREHMDYILVIKSIARDNVHINVTVCRVKTKPEPSEPKETTPAIKKDEPRDPFLPAGYRR